MCSLNDIIDCTALNFSQTQRRLRSPKHVGVISSLFLDDFLDDSMILSDCIFHCCLCFMYLNYSFPL